MRLTGAADFLAIADMHFLPRRRYQAKPRPPATFGNLPMFAAAPSFKSRLFYRFLQRDRRALFDLRTALVA